MDEHTENEKAAAAGTEEKKVDAAYKDAVEKDKKEPGSASAPAMPEASFGLFLSGLMMEALVSLGDLEHPVTKKKDVSIPHAKFIIDTIAMLKEKTKNNLSSEEAGALESVLYDLRMRFVAKSKT
jgi:hypothetical protein